MNTEDYHSWVMTQEYQEDVRVDYSDLNKYHTCFRCGEMIRGTRASILHWEKKHRAKVYPDGLPFAVVAV